MREHSDTDLSCGQLFEETTDNALVGEAQLSEQNNEVVNAAVATDDRLYIPPPTVCSKIQATESQDSLRKFIANIFCSLQDDNAK
jgi:hypothetical protein